jgi:hypothetical protein
MAAPMTFENLAATMKREHALPLRECRLSAPVEPLWGRPYRLLEWVLKSVPGVQRRVVPVDSTPSQIADVLKAHIPGRRYGAEDED